MKLRPFLSREEYYYADHMNAILGVYTDLDEFTNLQCDYVETWEKCEHLEKELSKSRTMSKSFEALQKHAINLELDLQQNISGISVIWNLMQIKQTHILGLWRIWFIGPIHDYYQKGYYVEGFLNSIIYSPLVIIHVMTDVEVAFRKSTCYIRDLKGNDLLHRDGENLDKMKEKKGGDMYFCWIFTQFKGFTDHVSSDPGPQCSTTVLEQDSLSPGPQSQENVPQVAETVTTSNELELLYSPMFSELLNGNSHKLSNLGTLGVLEPWPPPREEESSYTLVL
ncbi:hypothetical protein Tco_0761508 [Tanacetum coccineum]